MRPTVARYAILCRQTLDHTLCAENIDFHSEPHTDDVDRVRDRQTVLSFGKLELFPFVEPLHALS